MSIKDQIRAEIERQRMDTAIGICEFDQGVENGRMQVLDSLLSFIDSLPEQPVEGLEEEIDNAIYGEFYAHCRVAAGELPDREPGVYVQIKEGGPWIPVNDWKHHRYIATDDTIKKIARHFAGWGAEHLKR